MRGKPPGAGKPGPGQHRRTRYVGVVARGRAELVWAAQSGVWAGGWESGDVLDRAWLATGDVVLIFADVDSNLIMVRYSSCHSFRWRIADTIRTGHCGLQDCESVSGSTTQQQKRQSSSLAKATRCYPASWQQLSQVRW